NFGGASTQSPPGLMLLANLTIGHIVNSEGFLRPPSPQLWGSKHSKSPRIDAAGEFNSWKYWRRSEGSLRPPATNSGGAILKVPQNWGI
ncbi:MAG: hypothetical protein MJA27_13225, partial [Pseudanabaenales cyanobacterium]|nr:hypothetical protein [Pseudanabaenales cyanobacterium]